MSHRDARYRFQEISPYRGGSGRVLGGSGRVREASLKIVGHPNTIGGWAAPIEKLLLQKLQIDPKNLQRKVWEGPGRVREASLKKVGHPITLGGWDGTREKLLQQKLQIDPRNLWRRALEGLGGEFEKSRPSQHTRGYPFWGVWSQRKTSLPKVVD